MGNKISEPLSAFLQSQWHPAKNGTLLASEVSSQSNKRAYWICENNHEWDAIIFGRTKQPACSFCSEIKVWPGETDLATKFPEIAKQWHPTKNTVSASNILYTSSKKAWWQCEKEHEWQALVYVRTNRGQGLCKACNSIVYSHPELAKEWHPTKNGKLSILDVSKGSMKKIWWLCEEGHSWEALPHNRIAGSGCLVCRSKQVLQGHNDFASLHPELAKEWHPTKNGTNTPWNIFEKSGFDAWWLCDKGHEWQTKVLVRAKSHSPCIYCSGRSLLKGFNDLATVNPKIAAEWHPTKNGQLTPDMFTYKSIEKVWWLCEKGHEWESIIYDRNIASKCLYCSNAKVLAGYNDLATISPEIAIEWDYEKNEGKKPTEVTAGSKTVAWWRCASKNHSWSAPVGERKKYGCPVCSNNTVLAGYNDVATTHPVLIEEWHPTKNLPLLPSEFTAGSNKKVYWLCERGHDWPATIHSRTGSNAGCPKCSSYISKAEKELYDFLVSLGLTVIQSDRKVLNGLELDLYVPSHRFAIEFNGLYWHTEGNGKGSTYHEGKFLKARAAGVDLGQIWEDDFRDRKSIVLRAIASRLGLLGEAFMVYPELRSPFPIIPPQELSVASVTHAEAAVFLSEHHLQGSTEGDHYLALVDVTGNIHSVMVLNEATSGNFEILRFAAVHSEDAMFAKLLSHVTGILGATQVEAISNNTWSSSTLLEGNGFVLTKELPVSAYYFVGGLRLATADTRLKDMKDEKRIWDAGSIAFIKNSYS